MVERIPVYNQGSFVFVPDENECYVPASVVETFEKGKKGSVKLIGFGNGTKTLSPAESNLVERMDAQSQKDVEDMITLKLLNDASLLHNLRQRYKKDRMDIYTNVGSILVSINPYKDLGLYNADQENIYLDSRGILSEKPPHIFKVAEHAFTTMREEDKDQSCVVTGESGAGKTEATKRFLQYIAERSARNRDNFGGESGIDSQLLRSQILDSNPFMEAFGNAKTLRNDNSSRFGKLIELYFETGKGVVIGAKITNYLLEKSRVVRVQKGERNYHIFYQICAAAINTKPDMKKQYHLMAADQFFYCLGGNSKMSDLLVPDTNDAMVFEETRAAMTKLGMTDSDMDVVWRTCAGILHLGNVAFDGKDFAKLASGVKETALRRAGELLGVDPEALETACIMRDLTNIIKNEAGVQKHHSKGEAEAARDALAKHLYNKLFEWLIQKMNEALQIHMTAAGGGANVRVLGVLDIFGFESFAINSFEQLCINFCNEKLQAFFNDHVFKREQEIYRQEGIDARNVGFYDNQGVVDCIETGPKSIINICDDQCWLESATDKQFLTHILNNAKKESDKDAYLQAPKIQDIRKEKHLANAFKIIHFAGPVHYNVEGFLEKNKDQLRFDLRKLLSESSVELLASFFPNDGEGNGPGRSAQYRKTLGTKFKESLTRLMDRLNHTTPQFVRTIKPNDEKAPGVFHAPKIFRQLREAGLLEVCKIRKMGYPIRKTHKEFYHAYLCLEKSAKDVHHLCKLLSEKGVLHGKKSPNWQIGKTKVFLRAEQADELEQLRGQALAGVLKIIHNAARRFVFRNRIRKAVQAHRDIRTAMKTRDPELLRKALNFFLEKGPEFENLGFVQQGLVMMKELQKQLDVLDALEKAIAAKEVSSIKVNLELAQGMGLGSHATVKAAEELLHTLETEKLVKARLQSAIGSQEISDLRAAIQFAEENGFKELKETKMAANLLETLDEREKMLKALEAALKSGNVEQITEIVEKLRRNGCPDSHPLIIEAVRKTEMILEQNKKREQRVATLEKQLRKNIKKKDLKKLKDLVNAAIQLKYTGPLVKEAVEIIQALEQRNELIEEVVKATRVLREKSKMPDGITEADLIPLSHAIGQAKALVELDLGNEVQVRDGEALLALMKEQLQVQTELAEALKKGTEAALYSALKKVQRLGLQTRDADILCQKVREYEALRSKAETYNNILRRADILERLRVPTPEEREKHLLNRIDKMYGLEFKNRAIEASKNRDLAMKNYYKVRNDADFVVKEFYKKERAQLKHAYIPFRITKPLLEMDSEQEEIALNVNRSILQFCDGLGAKTSSEARAIFIVTTGLSDPVLADEIYIQLCKHLTANPNPISKNKGWHLMCMCTTFFGCSTLFEPYLLHFLQNSVNDAGLEGNYARYSLAQLSSSMIIKGDEVLFKPGSAEIKAFNERPPVLAQIESVDGSVIDIPIPPDYRLNFAAKLIRRVTKIMVTLDKPEWAIYVRATSKPPVVSYKTRLENFYRKYKPENLANVDSILKYHEGNEEALFADLVQISNYGPEPVPVVVGPKKKKPKQKQAEGGDNMFMELDDDAESQFSAGSKSSLGSAISKATSKISRFFRRARGVTYNINDFDAPNPTIPWPLPWWCYIGDIMHALYEQDKIPVLTYKRRVCKMKGKPDEHLYLQLQRDFLDGTLVPYTEGENARFSVMILAVKLLQAGKQVPYGDRDKLLEAGLAKCIPKTLRRENKNKADFLESYAELAAKKSNDLPDYNDVTKLQNRFFEECLNTPTYGMSFFFAHVLKGNVESYFAKSGEEAGDGVKIGINQKEVAFFQGGSKYASFSLDEVVKFWADGATFNMKVKRSKSKKAERDRELYDVSLRTGGNVPTNNANKTKTSKKGGGLLSLFFNSSETISLYTLQPREMYDLVWLFKHYEE